MTYEYFTLEIYKTDSSWFPYKHNFNETVFENSDAILNYLGERGWRVIIYFDTKQENFEKYLLEKKIL